MPGTSVRYVQGGPSALRSFLLAAALALAALLTWSAPASALNYVYNSGNDDYWAVHDAAIPGLDTGSIETTGGDTLQGYGGIRMQVVGAPKTPRLNKALMRGFGLTYDGVDSFRSHDAVEMGGVAVTRALYINRAESYARFYDTFTNTTSAPLTVKVAFGGQLGGKTNYGGPYHQSAVVDSSSGDAVADTGDSWVLVTTGEPSVYGPSATVLGSPGGFDKTGNFLQDPFTRAMETEGDEGNHYGYVNELSLDPGETASLLRYVVIALSETASTPGGDPAPAAGTQIKLVEEGAEALAATPDLSNLTTGELCTIANFDEAEIVAGRPGFDSEDCPETLPDVPLPVDGEEEATTSSPYDVVGKTVVELLADMDSGNTNAQQIMRAYLDRIAAYDQGPFGFHSFISINPDAMAQAREADEMRAEGSDLPLLGIPVAVKDIIDTEELKTTGGSLVFKNFRPLADSFIVARLRAAGAIVIGKANLSEFANSGHYSESAFGQVWNAFDPSKSSIGSSGGSAVAVAASLAPVALGSQTGDSLWGPASGASLVSMRGTDGQTSAAGTMPLTYLQDYVGAFTRTVTDQALVLNAIAADNAADYAQRIGGAGWAGQRPADWRDHLDPNALQGKTIGYYPAAFEDPFGTEDTSAQLQDQFKYFTAAGATVKTIAPPPGPPSRSEFYSGDLGYTGWVKWIQGEPNSPYTDPEEILRSPLRLPTYRDTSPYTGPGAMSEEDLEGFVAYRQAYQQRLTDWMDEEEVDAVVFPGHLSYIHLNDSAPPSFGRLDPQSSNSGVPTMIIPAGTNSDGDPGNLQLEGRPFSDAELLAMAYDFELESDGHVETAYAPALRYDPDSVARPVTVTPAPSPSSATPPDVIPPLEGGPAPAPVAVPAKLLFKKMKRVKSSGAVFIKVRVSGKGYLVAKSGQVRRVVRTPRAARSLWIPLRAKGRALAALNEQGRVRVEVRLKFVAADGATTAKTRTVVLVKK